MILDELTLRNFGLFAGEQVFQLRPGQKNGKHLPITLFGGMNGAGKTTLLDAIQLALYGARAYCSKRSNLPYDDFLRECIHRGAAVEDRAAVTLTFHYTMDGEEHVYDVARSWRLDEGRVRE